MPDFVLTPATLEVRGRVALVSLPVRGETPAGVGFESDLVVVTVLDDNLRIVEDHFFAPEQWPEARARFEELSGADHPNARPPEVENQLTRSLFESLVRIANVEVDAVDLVAEDVVIRDHRAGVSGGTIAGRDAFVANAGAHLDVFAHVRPTVLAVRGEHFALIQMEFETDGFTSIRLNLFETNQAGQLVALGVFDETDFGRALDELDERFIAGEGPNDEYLIRRSRDFTRSMAQLDGAATLGLLDPEIEFVDHRPLGLGTTGIDGVRSIVAARAEQVTEDVSYFRTLSVRGDAVLGYVDSRGVDSHGTAALYEMYWVSRFAAGKVVWNGWYDLADHAAAHAKFEELAAETRTPYVDNAVIRLLVRGMWRSRFEDTFDVSADVSDDLVLVDHRRGVSLPDLHGADELRAASREQEALFGPIDIEPVAVRGDRLALVHTRAVAASGFETGGYGIFEIDEAGRQNAMTFFDDEAVDTAHDALDARYAEIRTDDPSPVERAMAEVIPDSSQRFTKQYSHGHAGILVVHLTGTTAEGSEYDWHYVSVVVADDHDRISRMEYFPVDQWTQALARFDKLAAAANRPTLENRATAAGRRGMDAFTRGDRETALDVFAPDFVRSDRRRGPNIGDTVDREQYVDATLAGAEVGMAQFEMTPIEVVGDDHSLVAARWHNDDGFELEWLLVTEVDTNDRIRRITNFDIDEQNEASALLHEWATERPPLTSGMMERSAARMDALDRGDRDAVLATYAPDFVREDRRRGVNFGTSNREETVDALLAGNDVGLGNRSATVLEVIDDNLALAEFRMSHDDGFEVVYLLALEDDDDGRLRRAANFDLEDRAKASALLHLWAAERGASP